jgi:pyrroloquinoline quinone (PQQ) biosynthesis protein C
MANSMEFSAASVKHLQEKLNNHPLYESIQTMDDLRLFMANHIYPVWDFMCLLKYLQYRIAPASYPWKPHANSATRFFINQIVLGEESDEGLPDAEGNPSYISHFELYCEAMREIGADPSPAIHFCEMAYEHGIDYALALDSTPAPARDFVRTTFNFIATGKTHVVGSAFALGREHIIPEMFRSFLARMNITKQDAPVFHYYLERHIHLDEDFHAPMALKMMNELTVQDPHKVHEAEQAACSAVQARIQLWDGVLKAITENKK